MSEVISSSESNSYYDNSTQVIGGERDKGKITQLQQEELSPIDYKTQTLLTLFFSSLGVSDFYAGNHLQGLAKLAATVFISPFISSFFISPFVKGGIMPIIVLVSLIQLSSGQYTDVDGKVIRQVVQLKKEEMSSCDQKIAMILSLVLGFVGGHQFYAGKPLKGIMMLCSLGGLGIWNAINIYQLATCGFTDGQGKMVCPDYIKLSAQN